jgi:hypothetical protein
MDLQGLMIPTRQLHSLCTWCIRNKYRTGDGCDYAGTRYFDKNNNPVDDPSLDECNGTLTACKLRHGDGNELPFGGSPEHPYQELICVRKPLMPSWRTLQRNIRVSAAAWWRRSRVERYFPCRNLQQSRLNIFTCPRRLRTAEDWGTVVAIVHSHPDATTQAERAG